MATVIGLTSDWQDMGSLENNLKMGKSVIEFLKSDPNVQKIYHLGDVADTHLFGGDNHSLRDLKGLEATIKQTMDDLHEGKIVTKNIQKAMMEQNQLMQKYGGPEEFQRAIQEQKLDGNEIQMIQKSQELQHKDIQLISMSKYFTENLYKPLNKYITESGVDIEFLAGNNDNYRALANEPNLKLIGDSTKSSVGNINVRGFNHTNYNNSKVFDKELGGAAQDDNYILEKSRIYRELEGDKPNMILTHHAPGFANPETETIEIYNPDSGETEDKKIQGYDKFIEEYEGPTLVTANGHKGQGITFYKNSKGAKIINLNLNNDPNKREWYSAKTYFNDDSGEIEKIEVYKHRA